MRNGAAACSTSTSTVSRNSSRLWPVNQGVRSLGTVTLSPWSALIGIGVTVASSGEAGEVAADRVEHAAIEPHQVHLVDGQDEARDAEHVRDARVAARLLLHAVPGIDEEDGDVGRRRAGRHVARVLLVPGRVGQDELPARGRKVAIRDVNRDALLALGPQPVGEEREINRPCGLVACRRLDRLHLILVHAPASRTAISR